MKRLKNMSDAALFASLERLAIHERRNLPKILGHLAELSGRAASPPGYPSLFAYCLGRLHWSEGETAKRIHAARTASRFPEIYLRIWKGQLSISAVCLLAPHLTNENRGELIKRALRLSKRELETFVATLSPQAERSEKIRTLGASPPAAA